MSSVAFRPGQAAFLLIVTGLLSVVASSRVATQAALPSWAGWARCQLDVQGAGYTEHQIHTWTSSGGTPTVEGAFRVYPGTWSVVGAGSLQRTQGTQTLVAQWAINGSMANAPLAVFVRASDGRLLLQARHAQLRAAGAVAGYQQQFIDGKPQTPVQISSEAFEFAFPLINAPATDKSVSGSSAPPVNGSVGFMQVGGSRVTASCDWTFGEGTAAPAPPTALASVPVPVPVSTTVSTGAPAPPPAGGSVPSAPTAPTATPVLPALISVVTLCPLRGVPPPSRSDNTYSPASAYLKWLQVAGPTAYEVLREDLGVVGTVKSSSATFQTFAHRAPLMPGTTYKYAIRAVYPDGCGITWFDVKTTADSPIANASSSGAGPGGVVVNWNLPVPDAHAHIEGPGLPPGGLDSRSLVSWTQMERLSAGTLNIVGVPRGSQTWTVRAVWGTGPDAVKSPPTSVTFMVP